MSVSKITKLLVKFGQKDLVRTVSKAAKSTTKTITLPFKKFKDLQEPKLGDTRAEKVANIFLKPLVYMNAGLGIAGAAVGLGGLTYSGYNFGKCLDSDGFNDKTYFENCDNITEGMYVADRSLAVLGGSVLGTAIAGPIGGLVLGGAMLASDVTPVLNTCAKLDKNTQDIWQRDKQEVKKNLQNDIENIFDKDKE